jgi:hypothetical protein
LLPFGKAMTDFGSFICWNTLISTSTKIFIH